jgi:hypothetical protein
MKTRVIRTALAYTACMFLGTSIASAQATRTWVSGVGDDVNPCSRTAPCKTFAGAISKTAAGGEISVLDPGGFGGVTITKSLTISGVGINSSVLSTSATNGIVINAGPNDVVTLRHLQVNGAGSGNIGIRQFNGAALVVDDVNVFGFDTGIETNTGNTTVTHSVISNNRGFGLNGKGGTLTIESSMITTNNVAVQATGAGQVRLSDNSIYNNLTGFGCGGGVLASAGNNRKAGNVGGVVPVCAPTTTIAIQ